MFQILRREQLNPSVVRMVIDAPLIAQKAEPGQFVILRVEEQGERIPLTVADYDRAAGTITIIFQVAGSTTALLSEKKEKEYILDFAGPLGTTSHLQAFKKVAVIGGGVGCAIAYPQAKKLHALGAQVDGITGFRSTSLIILENEFRAVCDKYICMNRPACDDARRLRDHPALRHQDHREHEPGDDRWHRHVRWMQADGGRQDPFRLCGRPRL